MSIAQWHCCEEFVFSLIFSGRIIIHNSWRVLFAQEIVSVTSPVTSTEEDGHELELEFQLEAAFAVCLMYTSLIATLDKCGEGSLFASSDAVSLLLTAWDFL
jgi:hypothetical protein